MYKKQMTLQRITCFLLIAAAALVFVYSLGFATDLYDSLSFFASYPETHRNYVDGAKLFLDIQPFNRELTTAGIILILSALSLFIFRTNERRRYYIANYITIGVNAILNVMVSVWAFTNVFDYKEKFLAVDFEKLANVAEKYDVTYTESTFWFDASYVVFGILLAATLLSLVNLALKIVAMTAEKELLSDSPKEV